MDEATVRAVEQVILERRAKTKWASDARLLNLVLADVRKLLPKGAPEGAGVRYNSNIKQHTEQGE